MATKVTKRFEFIIPVMGTVVIDKKPRMVHSGNLTVWGEGMKTADGYSYDLAGVSYKGDMHVYAEFVNAMMTPPIIESELHKAVISHLKFQYGDTEHLLNLPEADLAHALATEAIEPPTLPVPVADHFLPGKKFGDNIY